ncbi:MAG: cation:proton antiporter [Pseudomonadota bacterium]
MLNLFEATAMVLAVTAVACWVNAKFFKLPVAVGLLLVGLLVTILVAVTDRFAPQLSAGVHFGRLLGEVDYPKLVLDFMLAYLLFAGAMNINLGALMRRGWAAGVLATLGTVITMVLVAACFWGVCRLAGVAMPVSWALVFGALISPTDPIAVLAMTRRTDLEPHLQAQLEGEALFNDGVAVVLFKAVLAYAVGEAAGGGHTDLAGLAQHAAIESVGGMAVGLGVALAAVVVIYAINDWITETLVTLATATLVYTINLHFHLSGPLGVVVAGLVMASGWAARGLSEKARHYIHPFWHVVDEGMNAVLFFLVGLVAFLLKLSPPLVILLMAGPAIVLVCRWIAVALPGSALPLIGKKATLKLYNVLTWAGVRGGLSIAMVLSLPDVPERQPIFAAALGVVGFSILIQSLTMEKLAIRTGYGSARPDPEPTL